MYYCYVIQSTSSDKFYIGVTDDVQRRVEQHNDGVSKWTRGRGPWILRWQKEFNSLSDARRFENLLKRQKGGNGFYEITGLSRTGS